jgi:hypothetical protein
MLLHSLVELRYALGSLKRCTNWGWETRKILNLVRRSLSALRRASFRFLKVSNFAVPWCRCLSTPAGPSGRVKLAPKNLKTADDAKEVGVSVSSLGAPP